ncbi:MAG: carboxypeptidase regulatory-like domain-containing protein [bacterium]|nr:carboxypeptidase regulatory-like domain-containing protein [bacterium]
MVRSVTSGLEREPGQLFDLGQHNSENLPGFAVGQLLWDANDPVGLMDNVAIADNGSIAAVGVSLNSFRLQVFDGLTGELFYEVPGEDGLSAVAVSPTGSHVVWAQTRTLRVLTGENGTELWSTTIPDDSYYSGIALSRAGDYVLALMTHGTDSLYLSLYPIESSEPVWEAALPMMAANNQWIGARFSGDGTRIVATSRFRLFALDASTGDMIWNEDGRNTEHPATVSGNGRIIAAAGNNDGKVRCYLWDQANSTYILFWEYRFSGGTSNWGTATAVSYDGQTIAGGSMQFNSTGYEGYVAVFETNGGGVPLWVSAGMGDLVGDIEISDDGLTVAACSWGYLNDSQPDIRVFQKYDAVPFFAYTHPGSPNDLDLSADGTSLIAGGKAVHNRLFGNGGNAYTFALDLEGGSANGTVTLDGTGDYSGVTIEALGTHLRATTSSDGSYQIDNIPAGTYTLTARKLGYSWDTVPGVVITEDGLTSGVNFDLVLTEQAPQNLATVSGQLRSIDLSWSALGTFARSNRAHDALIAVGDSPLTRSSDAEHTSVSEGIEDNLPRRTPHRSLDDPDSIHIWRAPLAGGPYALIGSAVGTATTYSDSVRVYPAFTYYYVVTGVYSNGESEYSNEAAGSLDDSYLVYDPVVPPAVSPVTFDGVISQGEWTDAVRIDISDVYGYDGSNPPQTAYLYLKYNDTNDMLYLACEDHANPSLDEGEGFGIYFDDDDSDTWSYSRPGSEGNYWAYYYASGATLRYRSLSGAPHNVEPYYVFANPQIGFSTASGYFSGEVAIPLGFHDLYQVALYGPDKTPGLGFFVIQRQAGNPIFDGWWPQNMPSIVSNPEYFSNTSIQATLPVPPAPPTDVSVTPVGNNLQVTWTDPTQGVDGLPVNGLAGLILYRNAEVYDFMPVGVQTYTDEAATFGAWYDYSITGYILDDDVEFEGPPSAVVGAYAGVTPEIEYLTYDDGTWEFFMIVSGLYDENRFAIRCNMPTGNEFVYTAQIAVNSIAPIGIGIALDNGGLPEAQLIGPYFITPPVTNEMFTIHFPGEAVAPGGCVLDNFRLDRSTPC